MLLFLTVVKNKVEKKTKPTRQFENVLWEERRVVSGAKALNLSAWTHPNILVKGHTTCHPTGLHVRLPTEFLQLGNEEERVPRLHGANLERRLWFSQHKDDSAVSQRR